MILALHTFFGQAIVCLFTAEGALQQMVRWDVRQREIDFLEHIAQVLQKTNTKPKDVSAIMAVSGPGPFTAVRNLAVVIETWRSQHPEVKTYAIPSGYFLAALFPEAQHLFLAAGKNAFFAFDAAHPHKFQKLPIAELAHFSGRYGGFFSTEIQIPATLQSVPILSQKDAFAALLTQKEQFYVSSFQPEYGALPNIRL